MTGQISFTENFDGGGNYYVIFKQYLFLIDTFCPFLCYFSWSTTDHAAIQLDIADEVDEKTGRITGKTSAYILTVSVRMMAVADDSIVRLAARDEFINKGYFLKDTK
ncbi:unnamed protein product [Rotaria sordida]|uniref:Uncharacterized protein n=1 Tax=Rotaria sordida TaxID=392033 RepID=A0A815SJG6_9BILA|nr:unnamed protein product [Rotaria sordida]CAF1467363.1 unnamed protein product [Rotaria sordida]CAF1493952.1 unnamed protein product [Rotaria sordida]CAF1630276.1 unnamed protein product [Rotaria sordida]CAF3956163.1 unnamed protein product [Rotaria sordida]